jgi:hypothetical protein
VGSRCSGRRRDASERLGPKIAYVFDEAVNIYNDERGKWAIAWRYNVAINCFSAEGDKNTFVEQEAVEATRAPQCASIAKSPASISTADMPST